MNRFAIRMLTAVAILIGGWPIDGAALSATSEQGIAVRRLSDGVASGLAPNGEPGSVQIGWLGDAMLLSERKYVFVNDSARQVYENHKGLTRSLSEAEPDLPFRLRLLGRLPGGAVLLADNHRGVLSVLAKANRLVRSGTYDPFVWRPVCMLANGSIIGRSIQRPPTATMRPRLGRRRDSVHYSARDREGRLRPIATTLADQAVRIQIKVSGSRWSTFRSVPLIFGDRTLVGCVNNRLIVAQTDQEVVTSVDQEGNVARVLPLPGNRAPVLSSHIPPERRVVMEADRRRTRVERRRYAYLASTTGIDIAYPFLQIDQLMQVPANDFAPQIDHLLTDANNRTWLRAFPMPEDEVACWHVWDY